MTDLYSNRYSGWNVRHFHALLTRESKGIFCTFYSDRGSHYWHTPEAGGKVDKSNPIQFGVALKPLGIDMIAVYSPEARGRSEPERKEMPLLSWQALTSMITFAKDLNESLEKI